MLPKLATVNSVYREFPLCALERHHACHSELHPATEATSASFANKPCTSQRFLVWHFQIPSCRDVLNVPSSASLSGHTSLLVLQGPVCSQIHPAKFSMSADWPLRTMVFNSCGIWAHVLRVLT